MRRVPDWQKDFCKDTWGRATYAVAYRCVAHAAREGPSN
jgi:hypothetical protein